MPILGQIIREIEREAASLSTAVLRDEIEINLEVQDAAIRQYYAVPPGGRNVEDLIMTNSAVMVSVLTTALYVRELATRLLPGAQDADEGVTDGADVKAPPGCPGRASAKSSASNS